MDGEWFASEPLFLALESGKTVTLPLGPDADGMCFPRALRLSSTGEVRALLPLLHPERTDVKFVQLRLAPSLDRGPGDQRSLEITDPASPLLTRPLFNTARSKNLLPCPTITSRSVRDLATQLRYDAATPAGGDRVNLDWVDWFMGLPRGHTAADTADGAIRIASTWEGRVRGVDLFSGVGGLSMALAPFVEPVAFCDTSPVARKILVNGMQSGRLPNAPVFEDVRDVTRETLADQGVQLPVEFVSGGFPCTDETTLFHELLRVADLCEATYIFLENVHNITSVAALQVLTALNAAGFEARYECVPASALGAMHRSDRWFCLARRSAVPQRPQQSPVLTSAGGSAFAMRSTWTADLAVNLRNEPTDLPRLVDSAHFVRADTEAYCARAGCLANAVVPLAARFAFLYLLTERAHYACALSDEVNAPLPTPDHKSATRWSSVIPKRSSLNRD